MSYKYKELKTQEEIDNFFSKACNNIQKLKNDESFILDWYKKDGIKIYGYFYKDTFSLSKSLICYGQTISPDNADQQNKPGVFSKLQFYGSSKRFLGLKNPYGETLLNNIYDEIEIFYETEIELYFKIKSKGKVGIAKYFLNSMDIIASPRYDSIFDAREYTWGYVINGNVGFMTITGQHITEAKYMNNENYNIFIDGKALTQLNQPETCKIYIDHYDNIVDYYQEESSFCGSGTGYYPFGDLPDSSDVYEGNCSNIWNTD